MPVPRFRPRILADDLSAGRYAQTALVDLWQTGRPVYVTGARSGPLHSWWLEADGTLRHQILGEDSPSDVALCVLDVDGDGWPDLVTGGAWYRNPGEPGSLFERRVFDADLGSVHDLRLGDIDGDGRDEVVCLSDRHDLRWYKLPEDPTHPWPHTRIGDPVHAGAALGDLDGDGALDVVRTDVWFRNVRGDGTEWEEIPIGPSTPPPPDMQESWAFNATRALVRDMNGDGVPDIVFTDAEIPGGAVWWMENVNGDGRSWRRHDIYTHPAGAPRRGPWHSLVVADLCGKGFPDVVSCEMEHIRGDAAPRWWLWENTDGSGTRWREHCLLDANLGGHELVAGDFFGHGRTDLIAKPWTPRPDNLLGGRMFVLALENLGWG